MIQTKTLKNGVRLVCEPIDSVRSATIGFWVGHGSRYEPAECGGISHAIEHMVFKGTETRSAAQVAQEMDAIGGQVNAFTTKESTCFYARSLDTHLGKSFDLLSDIFFHPSITEEDWETERGVILEEIGMYEDSPDDLVTERLFQNVFAPTPLAAPILGTPETLAAMTAKTLKDYKNRVYAPESLVFSAAGRFTPEDQQRWETELAALAPFPAPHAAAAGWNPGITLKEKPIEQNHLCIGFPGLPAGHKDRYILNILSNILGTGMSSRLFQAVREERGLCYSIYTFTAAHTDIGLTGIYTALGKNTERDALEVIRDVVDTFVKDGPTVDELERNREQIKANVLMSLESTSSRMHHLGQNELLTRHVPTPDEIIRDLDAVTCADIVQCAQKLLNFQNAGFSAVGQISPEERYADVLGVPTALHA